MKEHAKLDRPTAVGEHCIEFGHSFDRSNPRILAREQNWYSRKVRESIFIKVKRPIMNRDQGLQLPPVYNRILPLDRRLTEVPEPTVSETPEQPNPESTDSTPFRDQDR